MTSRAPFVLLDDARPGGRALLYSEPVETIETRDPASGGRDLTNMLQMTSIVTAELEDRVGPAELIEAI